MMIQHPAQIMQEGAGVAVKRLMPVPGFRHYDPFVLWDDFSITPGNGFPTHPHRGFEAITYLFHGSINHADNLGNNSTVVAGGAQRFTAGRGLEHSEMPHQHDSTRGIQLWINLPRRLKQVSPSYQQVDAGQFPIEDNNGVHIKTLVGEGSPLTLLTPVRYLEIKLTAGAVHLEQIEAAMRGFIYVVDGSININETLLRSADSLFFEQEKQLSLVAEKDAHVMLCYGRAHGEPIFQHGPFVD